MQYVIKLFFLQSKKTSAYRHISISAYREGWFKYFAIPSLIGLKLGIVFIFKQHCIDFIHFLNQIGQLAHRSHFSKFGVCFSCGNTDKRGYSTIRPAHSSGADFKYSNSNAGASHTTAAPSNVTSSPDRSATSFQ